MLSDSESNPLVPLYQEMDNVYDGIEFLDAVNDAAETAGCRFLFEIPGTLFDQPDYRAAAVLYDRGDETGEKVFILYNKEFGTIQILSEAEVDGQALRFVDSYANVLCCLNQLDSTMQLQ